MDHFRTTESSIITKISHSKLAPPKTSSPKYDTAASFCIYSICCFKSSNVEAIKCDTESAQYKHAFEIAQVAQAGTCVTVEAADVVRMAAGGEFGGRFGYSPSNHKSPIVFGS